MNRTPALPAGGGLPPGAFVLLGALLAGCLPAPLAEAQAPTEASAEAPRFERRIAPFPVLDAEAEAYPYPFFGGFNSPRPQLVDLTGNGRLDLAVQEVLDRVILFENTGEGLVWRSDDWGGIEVGSWFRFGDLTGDGLPDAIAQRPSGQVRFYRNEGAPGDPRFVLAADPLLDTRGEPVRAEDPNVPALADLYGTGRLDLFLGQADRGHIRHYRHAGVAEGVPRFEHVTERFQGIEIYEPNPSCDPAFRPEVPPTPLGGPGTSREGTRPTPPLGEVARRAGGGRAAGGDLPPVGHPPPSAGADSPPRGAVCSASTSGGAALPPPAGGSPPPVGRPTRLHGENALAFADLTGDGRLDLFWGDFFTPSLYFFRNEGTPTEPQLRFVSHRYPLDNPLTTAGYNAPTFGDLNGDGRKDLVLGIVGGFCSTTANLIDNLYLLRNEGTPSEPDFEEVTGQLIRGVDVGRVSVPALADLTGNGLPDLLVGSAYNPLPEGPRRGSLFLFRNTGTPEAPRFELAQTDYLALDLDFANHYAPAFVDLDADGRLDLVVGTFGGRLFWLRNEGSGPEASFGEPRPLLDAEGRPIDVGQTAVPTFGDLTGDGRPDLLAGSFRGTLHYYRNVGASDEPRFEMVSASFLEFREGRSSAPHLADLTGDGRPDLLVGTEHGGVHVFLNAGGFAEPAFTPAGRLDPGRAQLTPAAADLTGNGRPDLVLGTRAGGLVYLENVGP
jgi:hypothetical protein